MTSSAPQTLPPDVALQQAIAHHQAGRLQEAEQLYRAILQVQPNHPDANHNLGVLAAQLGQHAVSLPYLKTALSINPSQRQYALSLAQALLAAGQAVEALSILRFAMQRGLDTPELHALRQQAEAAARADVVKGEAPTPLDVSRLAALTNAGLFAELEASTRLLLEQYPNSGLAWKVLGASLGAQGKDALPALQRAAAVMPVDAEAHNNLGNALRDLGQLDGAVASCRRALEIKPDYAEAHYNLGIVLQALGRTDDAVASYRRALGIKPDFAEAYNNLGIALRDLRQLNDAVANYRRALEIKPDLAQVHDNLGLALRDLWQLDDAVASHRRALAIKPDLAQAHNNLGLALRDLGQIEKAVASHRRALAIKPDLAQAQVDLGNALQNLGQTDNAVASYRRALEIKPDLAQAHLNLGATLFMLGQFGNAAANCRRALEIKPNYAEAHRVLGDISREQGLLPDHLAPDAFDCANGRSLRRYLPYESSTFIYSIDISGTCNLRCPSCPVGNFPGASRPKGFMELDLFRAIVEKIKRDRAIVGNSKAWLFTWGEPLLHPKLPEMISLLKQNDIYVVISTNLNVKKKTIEQVIRSGPDDMKISLSGYTQEFYSRTHVKGIIELVKANMRYVRDLISRFGAPTKVRVGHHLYRHNCQEADAVRRLCSELGFSYSPIQAFYMSLEKMVDLIEGKGPASETGFLANLPMHPLDALALKRKTMNNNFDCESRFNTTAINCDGSVALCCGTYDNMLGVDFVNTSHDDIQASKYRHPFCKKCYEYGLQYSYRDIDRRAGSPANPKQKSPSNHGERRT